jgi:SnoaL-like domain
MNAQRREVEPRRYPRNARNAAEIHGFCAAVLEVRIHLPPAKSLRILVFHAWATLFLAEAIVGVSPARSGSIREELMKLCSLGLLAMLVTSPAYADEAMTVAQDIVSKWQTAYNNGDAAKVAALYTQDAVWVSPTGIEKGKAEIEKVVANLMKQSPKLTVSAVGAEQNGNVVWYYSNYIFPNGPR